MPDYTPDSFTDNPFVRSIGQMIAPGLFAEGGPPAAGAAGPPPVAPMRPPVADQRAAQLRDSMAIRQHYPQGRQATRGTGPGVGAGGPAMNMPGMMSSDVLNHPMVQQLLGQYGISPESIQHTVDNASPNMFITNPEAYQKHPVLSNILERGLEGAAFAKPSNTVGEGITNVAQSLLSAQAARADKYNNQLMMPFAQAQQVAALKGTNLQQEYERAQTNKADEMADYYSELPSIKNRLADLSAQRNTDQEGARKARANFSTLSALHDVALNPDEQQRFNKAMADAHGDPTQVDPSVLLDIHSSALQRKMNEQDAEKMKRAKVSSAGRIDTTAAANARAQRSGQLTAMKDDADAAEKSVGEFDKDLSAGTVTVKDAKGNDQILYPYSDDAAIAKARQDRVDKAEAARKKYFDQSSQEIQPSASPMVMPGVVPGASKPKQKAGQKPHGVMQADGTIKWD